MQENPYSSILGVIRKDADERACIGWMTGKVVSTAPLTVLTGGNQLSGADLLANAQLLPNVEQVSLASVKGNLAGSPEVTVSDGSLTASGFFGGALTPGDTVALMPSTDGQRFLVLCKVVNV